jgi:hypothetical protein
VAIYPVVENSRVSSIGALTLLFKNQLPHLFKIEAALQLEK